MGALMDRLDKGWYQSQTRHQVVLDEIRSCDEDDVNPRRGQHREREDEGIGDREEPVDKGRMEISAPTDP